MAAPRKLGGPSRLSSRDVVSHVQRAWGASPFYQARLKGPAPDRLYHQPVDPRTPDKLFARSFMEGRLNIGETAIDCEGDLAAIWNHGEEGGSASIFLQEFAWLRHLNALGEKGRPPAHTLLRAWLDRYEKWSPEAWEPYLTSERLIQLCCYAPLVLAQSDALWRSRVLTSMARQTRHLARSAHRANTGYDRLMTAMGLCLAGYCLPGCEAPAERGLELVRREMRLQLRPDGGHVSRNPSRQVSISLRLAMIVKVMEARKIPAPGYLRHAVGRASAIAQFFRCADGGLAVFNGGYEDDGRAVLAALDCVDENATPTGFARHTGYQKIAAARALVIVDVSTKSAGGASRFESAGSFHFSSGRSRIITNCGNGGHLSGEWRKALAQGGAHSALSFEGIQPGGAQLAFGETTHRRAEDARGQLIEFETELVTAQSENARYIRRFYLSADGGDLRGEENIEGLDAAVLRKAQWRFHLHPGVRASQARDGRSILLALPNKEGWRFRANAGKLQIEKSVYCGEGGSPVSTEQIVLLSGEDYLQEQSGIAVKWALRRLDGL